ncbi:hypothetical protein G3O08_12740 [Cryomorpha ignava]|uniref:Uncharacterized protein n=1 Tax=Cryomorpha ignava TaxID=101383 RepID=A0A7K3WRS6_9FLAO|nr:hypothetical protein [Cryomorpha ignava]NEN24373.1 hypothetical protein [Cryomorpha ignava]
MKTNSIFTLVFSMIVFTLCGQNIPAPQFEVTGSTADPSVAIDEIIEDLDLTDVTTNILYDRGWKLGSLENFDGALTSDTLHEHLEWLRQYGIRAIRILDG